MFRISEQKAENGRPGHSDENIVAETETIARTRPRRDRVMQSELWNKVEVLVRVGTTLEQPESQ